ncbi:MAG: DoxX family protein [Planctomycetota bacterium]
MRKTFLTLFPVLMILNGIVDLVGPEQVTSAMDSLAMPHYLLLILGAAKIAGGLTILLRAPAMLKEWAFAGFYFWCLGGLSAHALNGHAIGEYVPLLILGTLLTLTFVGHRRSVRQGSRPTEGQTDVTKASRSSAASTTPPASSSASSS